MSTIVRIIYRDGGRRDIVTDDDITHRIGPDAPDEVANYEISCGATYPFTDDGSGNAITIT